MADAQAGLHHCCLQVRVFHVEVHMMMKTVKALARLCVWTGSSDIHVPKSYVLFHIISQIIQLNN